MKSPLVWDPFRFWVLFAVVPLLAVLVTAVTGYLYISYGLGGYPAPWARLLFRQCLLTISCSANSICPICDTSKIVGVNVDWLPLGIDILFYTAIGYSLVLIFSWARPAGSFGAGTDPSIK